MKKILFLLPLLALVPRKGESCGFHIETDATRVHIFDPSPLLPEGQTPYFYTAKFLNTDDYDLWRIPDENLDEWRDYCGGAASKEDIKRLVYRTQMDTLQAISKLAGGGAYQDFGNGFADYIIKGGRKELADYLVFARGVEHIFGNDDPWGMGDPDPNGMDRAIDIAVERGSGGVKDPMLRQRYLYQAITLMQYANYAEEAVALYEKEFAGIPDEKASVLKYWALNHVAICRGRLRQEGQALMDFARVFARCDAKKYFAYNRFDRNHLDELIAGKPADEEAYYELLIAREFRNPGRSLHNLRKLAAINPDSDLFHSLLIREVNKLEDWILTRRYTPHHPAIYGYWNSPPEEVNYKGDFKYLEEVIGFLETQLLSGKIQKRKGLWELMVAHLYLVHESPKMADTYLRRARKNSDDPSEQFQIRLTSVMNKTLHAKAFDGDFEQRIWEDIGWLADHKDYTPQNHRAFTYLMLSLQQAYHHKKQYGRAALFYAYGSERERDHEYWKDDSENDYSWIWRYGRHHFWEHSDAFLYLDEYGSPKDAEDFLVVLESKKRSPLETFLVGDYQYPKQRYYDLIGTKYLRLDDLETALKWYKEVPDDFWDERFFYKENIALDPFRIYGDESILGEADFLEELKKGFHNKRLFTETLIQLKKDYAKAKGNKKARLGALIGNAYYNMSFHGKSWHIIAYARTRYDDYLPWTRHNVKINENYHSCGTALRYYKEAYGHCKGKEARAALLFLAGSIRIEADGYKYKEDNFFANEFTRKEYGEFHFWIDECPGWSP